MVFQECETLELKQVVVEDIKKEVIAFANCDGGKLYVGVNDDGEVVGVDSPDEVILRISGMVRDAIKPDVTMFAHYDILSENGKQIVEVDIQRGTSRPYYLGKKGLRPEGVYVRQGTSSVPATETAIRRMIKETDGDSFEQMRSLQQELTFEAAAAEFSRRGVAFGPQQRQTLKLVSSDGIYTNLGLLLSDQCAHTVKVAIFDGTDQSVFKDRREFSGSLMQQMNEVYQYIDLSNRTRSTFDKLLRIDVRDYPEAAVREALLNSLVHRDYGYRASTLISIYTDRMEFVSIGGLLPGIELEDVMIGLSVCRNESLADVFYRLQLIEAYGTGMRKIVGAYAGTDKTPAIECTTNAFKIILPNVNYVEPCLYTKPKGIEIGDIGEKTQVMMLMESSGWITRNEVEEELGISASTATRLLRKMVEDGVIVREGRAKNTRYRLKG